MKRSEALEKGDLLEVDTVINNESDLRKKFVVDSCAFDMAMFDRRLCGPFPDFRNQYTETVRLLTRFLESCEQAPDDTIEWGFEHTQFVRNGEGWKLDKWICKVTAGIEDGLRCLTFKEEG